MGLSLGDGTGGSGDFKPIPEGLHLAQCCGVYDLGTQRTTYNNSATWKRQVKLKFEVPSIRVEYEKGGQKQEGPAIVYSRLYTLSYDKRAWLRKDLESWLGKSLTDDQCKRLDLCRLLGRGAQLQIIHDAKNNTVYANINNILPLQVGQQVKGEIEPTHYSMDDHGFNFPESTPKWVIRKIEGYVSDGGERVVGCKEYEEMSQSTGNQTTQARDNDDPLANPAAEPFTPQDNAHDAPIDPVGGAEDDLPF